MGLIRQKMLMGVFCESDTCSISFYTCKSNTCWHRGLTRRMRGDNRVYQTTKGFERPLQCAGDLSVELFLKYLYQDPSYSGYGRYNGHDNGGATFHLALATNESKLGRSSKSVLIHVFLPYSVRRSRMSKETF